MSPSAATGAKAPESDVDPYADDVVLDPYRAYGELRELGPVVRLTTHPVWALPHHADVRAAASDHRRFSSEPSVGLSDEMTPYHLNGVLTLDPPRHEVLRQVLSDKMAPRALGQFRADMARRVDVLVTEALERGTLDAVTDLCARLPVDIVADLIGLPAEGREVLLPGADAMFRTFGPVNAQLHERLPAILGYMKYITAVSNRETLTPGSWGAAVLDAADDGRLPQDQVVPLMTAYLVAGMDTTVSSLSSYVHVLATRPDVWAELKEHPELISAGFEENLRLESPVQGFCRNTTGDVTIGDVTIPAGDRVLLLFGSANRDERHYPDADEFILTRNPVDHLAFGYGTHGCAGQALARMEARALLESLLHRLDRLELAGTPVQHLHPVVRGLESLPITVTPTTRLVS